MQVGAFEAKNTLGALLDRVEQGEEIVITRHGKAVARLAPCAKPIDQELSQVAFDRIRARAAGLPKVDWEMLKADRDAGRP